MRRNHIPLYATDPNVPCVVGQWDGVQYKIDSGGPAEGSGNFHLTISPDGAANADFSEMRPIDITSYRQKPGTTSLQDLPVSDLTGDGGVPGAGNTQPLLGAGKFTCADTKITVEQQLGETLVTWELLRQIP